MSGPTATLLPFRRPRPIPSSAPPVDPAGSVPDAPGWWPRIRPHLARHKLIVGSAMTLAALYAALTAFVPLLTQRIVDDAIVTHRLPVVPMIGLLGAAGVVIFLLSATWRYLSAKAALRVQHDLRNGIYDTLQRLDFTGHAQLQSGQLVSRASSDLRWIQVGMGWLPEVASTVIGISVSIVIMITLSPPLAAVVVVIIVVVFAVTHRMRTRVHAAGWDAQQREADMTTEVEESVTGVRVVRAFGQEDAETARLHRTLLAMFAARVRAVRLRAPFFASLMAGPQVGQVIMLALGGGLVLTGHLTIGVFLAFSSYLTGLAGKTRVAGMILSNFPQTQAAIERVGEILDLRPSMVEPAEPVRATGAGAISFRDVSFGYADGDGHLVLDGFDLDVAAGESIALVGPSGCGKSTAMQLVPRFFDAVDGQVLVDGVDVRDQSAAELRRRVGVVFENSFLFSDTIAANISYGVPDATPEQIERAARAAMAHDFITATPDGYDTVVGEQGMTLSGGQRQRVALARAILTDPDVLLLDDATSSVDVAVEREIHANLGPFLEARTTIMVAYRESTVRMADRVVLVEGGRVLDTGSHEELFARSPLYRDLFGDLAEDVPAGTAGGEQAAAELLPAARRGEFEPTASSWESRADQTGRLPAALRSLSEPTSPRIAARIAALPDFGDTPGLDLEAEGRTQERFTLLHFLKPYRFGLLAGLLLVAAEAVLNLINPLLIREGVNLGMIGKSTTALALVTAATLALVTGLFFVQRGSQLQTQRTTERLLVALRSRVYGQLQRLGIDFYDRTQTGRVMTRMTSDIDAIAELLQVGLINLMMAVLTFCGMSVVIVGLDWRLALIVLCVIPPAALGTWWYRRRASVAYDEARERTSLLNANLQESLAGIRVTHAYLREQRNLTAFSGLGGDFMLWSRRSAFATSTYVGMIEFLSTAATAATLGVGSVLIGNGSLALGTLLAFLLYLAQAFAPVQQMATVFDVYQRARAGLVRIRELLGLQTSTPVRADALDPGAVRGEIELEGVRLRYAGTSTDALKRVDLRIPAGQRVAFVGRTGAGKSTTVKMVSRFYDPTEGRILIDGEDLEHLDLARYRRQLGYVPQEPFLFSRSVRDNIAYARPEATDAEIEAAARAVGAHEFISRLPDGYHQVITERGRSLSAGQRQLLCLARALINDPAILILDEATSNLDLASERKVNQAMRVASRGRTTLVVTHRPQSLHWVQRVLVVADGEIVGDHEARRYLSETLGSGSADDVTESEDVALAG
ncbi:ATP-binding cassette subfamily B protein [Friedmanniella endophytica]|uniref:ATP-binding cassette subfamily B protein n=1 Tax=Microlunatus kandeliicorticis TaxID=1759536 RepID=A0A7W3P613_9ACTN|nr:ABC transporter ATP-binding protein [Microlunatus kandeliicorticis]MBA8794581.1 ATP-binding cassette subfamily B protein [Microlunatus kandeliicorticis]